MRTHLCQEAQILFATILVGAVALLAPGESAPFAKSRDAAPEVISPGEYSAVDLVFRHDRLRRTVVTVNSKISCLSENRCVMDLPAPMDEMIGVGLSGLGPADQERVILSFAGRDCFFEITGFFDGVQLDARKVGPSTSGDCARSSLYPITNR